MYFKLIIILLSIALHVMPAMAAETTEVEGCFEYYVESDKENQMFVMNTAKQLTNKKGSVIKNENDANKELNDIGKSLYGRIMKLSESRAMIMQARKVYVLKYPYPPLDWNDPKNQKRVLKEAKDVLCK